MQTKLEHALALAREGFWIFPCVPGGKKPAIKGWQAAATRDEQSLTEWFSTDFNIGIFTGKFRDNEALLVVDSDTKKGKNGDDTIIEHELAGREFSDTRIHYTASGTRHLIYRVARPVKQGAEVLGRGLDVRSRGGYIVGPGSSIGDRVYKLGAGSVADCPAWIVQRCGDGEPRRERLDHVQGPILVPSDSALSRARSYLAEAPLAIEGAGGDETTYKVACRVKDFGVPLGEAYALIHEWNERCLPPWGGDDLDTKVFNAYRYGQAPPGAAMPQADFTVVRPPRTGLPFELFHQIKPDLKKPALVAGWLDLDAFSVMFGPPGSAKSFNAINLGFCISTARPWFGNKVAQGGVLYLALEGGDGVKRRIEALKRHYELGDTFVPFAVARGPIDLSEAGKSMQELYDLIAAAEGEMDQKITLVIVDTFARANPGGDENSSKDMGVVVGKLDKLRAHFGFHVLVIHHTGKDVDRGMRGSNALLGAIDTAVLIIDGVISVPDDETGKQRDRGKGAAIGFKLVDVTIGSDANGDLVQSAVVIEAPDALKKVKPKPLSALTQVFFQALHDAGGVSKAAWLAMCRQRGIVSPKPDSARGQLSRAVRDLTAAGLIVVDGDLVTVKA